MMSGHGTNTIFFNQKYRMDVQNAPYPRIPLYVR